ncbi:MAG: MATE family efflux transporter [Candidatus Aminicenantes bacterium]|nr:MATE family efflux transporter [Candidatus Aminicenantes bacterium]
MNGNHKGVQTLLGDPKRAIIRLSLPMIVAASVQTLYNIVDAIWVSGLGPDALSAVGFFFPFYFLILALAAGLGVGAGSAVSRKIGGRDKAEAGDVAAHALVLMTLTGAAVMIPGLLFIEKIYRLMGAGSIAVEAARYSRVFIGAILLLFFASIASALLRGEGDVNRAMVAMMVGAGLNIGLDPLFIYTFKMGVAGAAWASILSIAVSCAFLFSWLFVRRNTYVSIHFRGFRFRRPILREILRVGVPASFQQMSMALTAFAINIFAVQAGGTDGVAIFTTGWRMVTFATLPLIGMAMAVTSVTGASFGAKDYGKLDTAYSFAVRVGFFIGLAVALLTFLFAPQIAWLFTMTGEGLRIRGDLISFLHIMCIFYPGVAFGMFSSAMFQGTAKGMNALIATILRTLFLAVPMAYLLSLPMKLGLPGIWWGIVVGNILGSVVAFTWGRAYVRELRSRKEVVRPVEAAI